jgi:hypothetical protein
MWPGCKRSGCEIAKRKADKMNVARMQVAIKSGGQASDGEPCRWPHVLARIIMHGHDASGQEFRWIECKIMQYHCIQAGCIMDAVPGG